MSPFRWMMVSGAVIAGLSAAGAGGQGSARADGGLVLKYAEDFSADPGWITDQPTNYYWDAASEAFHATTVNAQPGPSPTRYAYRSVEYQGNSLRLEFDIDPVSMAWSAGVAFGLFDANLQIQAGATAPDAHYILAHPGRVDGGLHMNLRARGNNDVQVEDLFPYDAYVEGVWYRCVIAYDATSDGATFTMTRRDTGALVGDLSISAIGGLPSDLDYLGFARDPAGDCCPPLGGGCPGYGCWAQATALLDNVALWEECDPDWELRAPLPGPRDEQACAAWDGVVYAVGDSPGSPNKNDAFLYDPQADSWTQLADMPTGRGQAAAAAIDGLIYVVGGNECFNCWLRTLEAYDTTTEAWITGLPDLPGDWERGLLSAAAVNGKLYAMGGANSYYVPTSSENFVYDPVTQSWSSAAPLPRPRSHHCAAVLNGKVYLIGGAYRYEHGEEIFPDEVDVYDPQSDTWSSAAPLPTPRYMPACAVSNGKIYVIGGGLDHADSPALSMVDVYDPATDSWTTGVELPSPRRQHCAVSVEDVLFVIGGNNEAEGRVATVFARLPCSPGGPTVLLRTGSEPDAACLGTGDALSIELQIANLPQAANGVQALVSYDPAVLSLNAAATVEAPGWTRIFLFDDAGEVTYAAIYNGGSVGPGAGPFTVATLAFDAVGEGSADVVFRADQFPFATKLTLAEDGGEISGDDLLKTDSGIVSVDDTEPTADNTGPACIGSDVQLLGGPDGMASYAWSGPEGYTSAEQSPVVSLAVAGEYCLIVTNADGCEFGPVCTTVETYPCLTVNITVPGLDDGPVERSVSVLLTACDEGTDLRAATVAFTPSGSAGVGTLLLTDVHPGLDWASVREGHTLSTLAAVNLGGGSATVNVTLRPGDLQTAAIPQDDVVDVLDFSILASRWEMPVADCTEGDPEDCSLGADVTGDGWQGQADFLLMQGYFFEVGEASDECGDSPFKPVPVTSISVADLVPVLERAEWADLTHDGTIDVRDIRALARRLKHPMSSKFETMFEQIELVEIGIDGA